ncbi:MAG: Transcriptional regulator MraZ [Acidimicrobiales bacterium]|nr:MAG: division/cell wall cluster transcriptional repressor MraZ [Actinomycetota bacterium]MBV6508759.1 Transcriptional regulator MraZ [Acidimicrobiales bacterium]RIK06505.1 MAG: division/cell wall cluster transcriptional repressor MraZ [Acidobacteriota bacterium]
MFVGTFEHSLDDKGRVVLPSSFRRDFAEGGILSLYDGCIALWTPKEFEGFVQRLTEKVRERQASPNAPRALAATAARVKADSQGRIGIPARLREQAALAGEVVLIGVLDHVEIWSTDAWQTVAAEADSSLSAAVKDLGI